MSGDNMTPPKETVTDPAPAVKVVNNDDDASVKSFVKEITQPTAEKNTINHAQEQIADTPAAAAPAQAAKPVTEKKMLSAGLTAELGIHAMDGIQSAIFTAVARKKLKNRMGDDLEEVELLEEKLLSKVVNLNEVEANPQLLLKYRKYKRLKELMEDIPFSEEEIARMERPLESMIIEAGYQMPPWMGFSLAIGDVMVKRIVTAFFD